MALPASPNAISLGQVNTELGYTSTQSISLNDAAVRTLFVKSSGAIAMSDGHGKSAYTPYLNTASFLTSGTWTVPAQVTSIRVKAWGGGGAAYARFGGGGGFISGYLAVTPGSTLAFSVGAAGVQNFETSYGGNCSPSGTVTSAYTSGGGGTGVYYGNPNPVYMIAGGGGANYGGGQTMGYNGEGGVGGGSYGGGAGLWGSVAQENDELGVVGGYTVQVRVVGRGQGGQGSHHTNYLNPNPSLGGNASLNGPGACCTTMGGGSAGQNHTYNSYGFVAAGGGAVMTGVCPTEYSFDYISEVGARGGGGWAGGGGSKGFGGAGGGSSGHSAGWTGQTVEAGQGGQGAGQGGMYDPDWGGYPNYPGFGGHYHGYAGIYRYGAGYPGKVVIKY